MWEYNCTELFDHESSRNATYLYICDKIVGFPFQQVPSKVEEDCNITNLALLIQMRRLPYTYCMYPGNPEWK